MGTARAAVGLLLVGYGFLILTGVLAHESLVAGILSLGLGLVVVRTAIPRLPLRRARAVAVVGALIALGVLAYNAVRVSTLSAPEWALVAYGCALVAVAPFLGRPVGSTEIGTLVAWSFPLVLAPLAVYAANAALSSPSAGAAASPLLLVLIVLPTLWSLRALGTPAALQDGAMVLETSRGTLVLDVGLVCAGIYPMILFGGIVGLHAWRTHMPAAKTVKIASCGLAGLWIVNLVRLVALARIGIEWGPGSLTEFHANLGWALFGLFMLAFAFLFLRQDPMKAAPSATSSLGVPVPPAGTPRPWWRVFPKRR